MNVYRYRAKKGPQDIIEGRIEADSEREAVDKLSMMGYLPVQINEDKEPLKPLGVLVKQKARVKPSEITIFSRQLASLLRSGVPILNALNIIKEQANPGLRSTLGGIYSAIKEGAAFSWALGQYPNLFSPLYIAIVRSGEDSGALPEALLRLSDYRAKQEEFVSRLRMAMAYPSLMAFVGIATVAFMFTFVIPRLTRIFVNMEQSLPIPTRILISISANLRDNWFWILLCVAVVVLLVRRQSKTKTGRSALSRIYLSLPVLGKLILKSELARFCRTLELLIRAGIPILKAIDVSIPVLGNEVISEQLMLSHKELEQGGSFGKSLKQSGLFPLFMTNLIIVGEESGKLDEALGEVANTFERETDEAARIAVNLLEPALILVIGLIVGFIVVAMLLPVFEINIMGR